MKNLRFTANYDIEEIKTESDDADNRFKKVKVWVAHTGWNLNKSNFSKELLNTMAEESLSYIPITAFVEVSDDTKDFAGHEEVVVINDDGVEFKYLGVPIGFIPKDNNYSFEEKDDKTWLTVEGIVWNKFETSDILGDMKNHSMELLPTNLEGTYEKDYEGDTGWVMTSATFDALCALGDNHTPAMTGSIIETFSNKFSKVEDNKSFANDMKEMLKEMINEYTSYVKGGENVKKKKEGNFELTDDQIRDMLYKVIEDKEMYAWGLKFDSKIVYYKKDWDGIMFYGVEYSLDGTDATIDWDTEKEYIMQPILKENADFEINEKVFETMKSDLENVITEKFTKEIDELKLTHTTELEAQMSAKEVEINDLKTENEELTSFKNNSLETQRKEYVESVENLSKDEKNELIEKVSEFTMEQLETEIAVIIGRNSIKFTTKKDDDMLDKKNTFGLDDDFDDKKIDAKYKGKSYENLIKK